jgi:hypothetical protein
MAERAHITAALRATIESAKLAKARDDAADLSLDRSLDAKETSESPSGEERSL